MPADWPAAPAGELFRPWTLDSRDAAGAMVPEDPERWVREVVAPYVERLLGEGGS